MTPQTSALVAVADLARAYEGAKREGRQAKATIERLQGALTSSSKEAVEFEHQARTYQRQGRKTRSKLRAQREEIKKLRAELASSKEREARLLRETGARHRQNCQLREDLGRMRPSISFSRFYEVDSAMNPRMEVVRIKAHALDFRFATYELSHFRTEAGLEVVAEGMARRTAKELTGVYLRELKAAAGIR